MTKYFVEIYVSDITLLTMFIPQEKQEFSSIWCSCGPAAASAVASVSKSECVRVWCLSFMPRETSRGASFHSRTTGIDCCSSLFFHEFRTSGVRKGLVCILGLAASSALTTVFLDSQAGAHTLADRACRPPSWTHPTCRRHLGIKTTSPN